jgi:hypothetical protein
VHRSKTLKRLAGAPGLEPGNGGIKIAGRDNKIKVHSDNSRCVHVKAHQLVSNPVGTLRSASHPTRPLRRMLSQKPISELLMLRSRE